MTQRERWVVRSLALAVLLAAAPLVGCGNSEDSGSGSGDGEGETKTKKTTKALSKSATKNAGGDGDSGYTEVDNVENAGRITGTISYRGTRTAGTLEVNKDQAVCTHGGQPDGSLVVADGHLNNAIIYLVEIERGKKWGTEPATLDNRECIFEPRVGIARHRGEVTITNSDPLLHNTNLVLHEGARTLGNVSLPRQGQTSNQRLRKEGLVEIKCDVHPWMKAFLFVTPHPYAVVSAADGTFTLDGVPPGTYKVKIWHELLGEKEMNVTVEANGTATLDVAFE
jgi:hypothetical protein